MTALGFPTSIHPSPADGVPIAPEEPNLTALILPGGGMRVAYQMGAVKALFDSGMRFSIADAASGGTINLAALLSGITPDDLCARWRSLDVRRFLSPRPLLTYLRFPNFGAFGDFDGIKRSVFPHLGIDLSRIARAGGIRATFNVCDFADKVVVPFPQGKMTLELLLAGISLPLVTPPVSQGGRTYTDAVWIRDCNLLAAVENGASELWVVWCIGNTPRFEDGVLEQYVHMIEMSALGALHADFAAIAAINARIAAGERPFGRAEPIVVHLIKPEFPLPLDPDFLEGRIDASTLIALGYRDASKYLAQRPTSGIKLTPAATKMTLRKPGLTFRETMTGRLTMGVSDPDQGYRDHGAHALALRATIQIDDIAAFVSDPTHTGDLVGFVSDPRLGGDFPATRGVFGLFSPSGDKQTTWMVYETGLCIGGKQYWLCGRKHVTIASPLSLWPATTTLYITLHEGVDNTGPIVGAGILRLGVFDLFALLGTLRATGCRNLGERLRTIMMFTGFFVRELMRTYLLRRPLP